MLVGDLVQATREAVTDQSQTLPNTVATVAVVSSGGSTLPTGTYACVVTQRNPWGETLNASETTGLAVGANQGIQITSPLQPGATIIRAYLTMPGGAAGTEQQFIESSVSPFTISTPLPSAGVPPTQSRAYLPDTDGDAVNASTLFRFLNDALTLGSQVCGGLFDYAGIGTVSGAPQYILTDQWKKISSLWYDGYPLAMDDAGNFFRRNAITASILASVACSLFTDRMMLEVWPQPSRTAAATTLASPLAVTDTQAVLTSAAGFLLTNGYVKIGSEMMSYSGIAGNTLKNLIRGLGGTNIAAASAGATVNELNMFWQGWRSYAPKFKPGDSFLTVPAPLGWETQLFKYMLGRVKLAEQGVQEFSALEGAFKKDMGDWYRTNHVNVGPRQVGEQSNTLEVMPNMGGGWVIPAIFICFSLMRLMT